MEMQTKISRGVLHGGEEGREGARRGKISSYSVFLRDLGGKCKKSLIFLLKLHIIIAVLP